MYVYIYICILCTYIKYEEQRRQNICNLSVVRTPINVVFLLPTASARFFDASQLANRVSTKSVVFAVDVVNAVMSARNDSTSERDERTLSRKSADAASFARKSGLSS